jgi:hypothetical protein
LIEEAFILIFLWVFEESFFGGFHWKDVKGNVELEWFFL